MQPGDTVRIKTEHGDFTVEILALSEMRGPASVAQTLYRETEASRESRMKLMEARRAMPPVEMERQGKPSKRDRRQINRLRSQ